MYRTQANGGHAQTGGTVDSAFPHVPAFRLRIGIDGTENASAPLVGVVDAFSCALVIEIQACELASVGTVPEAEVDRVGAVVP